MSKPDDEDNHTMSRGAVLGLLLALAAYTTILWVLTEVYR